MDTSGSPPVVSAVTKRCCCSAHGTISMTTSMPSWLASNASIVASQAAMSFGLVENCQKVTVCAKAGVVAMIVASAVAISTLCCMIVPPLISSLRAPVRTAGTGICHR